MSISIQENRYGMPENVDESLFESIHSTLNPLSALIHGLRDAENEDVCNLGVVLSVLLDQAMDVQTDLLCYLEKKIGSVDFVHARPSCSVVHRNIVGLKVDGRRCGCGDSTFRGSTERCRCGKGGCCGG